MPWLEIANSSLSTRSGALDLTIHQDFSKQPLPPKYIKNDNECYLDSIRKRLTYITPEETIRQQVISYLINDLKVPEMMIKCEESLSHYGIASRNRVDIIIHRMENDSLVPVAVIECKAPDIFLGKRETDQLVGYANALYCDYLLLTNGYDSLFYHYDDESDQYLIIDEFPTYAEMLNSQHELTVIEPLPDRIPFSKLEDHIKEYRDYGESTDIGENTPIDKAVLSLNLWDGILDVRSTLPLGKYSLFAIKEDLGVRLISYGNASGGVFSGPYRSFLIECEGMNQIISFGMSAYTTCNRPDIVKTSLNVAIDTDKSAHHSLQLVIDDNVVCEGDSFSFYHHGKIAVGNKGSGKISELKKLVDAYCPRIIHKNRIYLGTLKNDKLLELADPAVIHLIENLISYAIVRDIFRNKIKSDLVTFPKKR